MKADRVQPTGAVAGYRPERTLRLSVELRRQFKRRRTIGIFALMVALPLILIAALQLGGTSRAEALQALVGAGIAVEQFTPRRRLEDAFLALVGEGS